jgi:2-polyprenyl-3-methyl-5-hydroxy-6-metoxy-1,4-benzoquinol methylase
MANPIKCQICGSSTLKIAFTEYNQNKPYTSYFCKSCNLYQTLGEIAPISPDYVKLVEADLNDEHKFLQTTHKQLAFRQWRNLLPSNESSNIGNQSVLDIGCGIGGFLDYAKILGYETFGFDASDAHIAASQVKHPLTRKATTIDTYFQQLNSIPTIDYITLWDVFEHIRQPRPLLREIHKCISSSSGYLFISVPSGALHPLRVKAAKILNNTPGLIPWEHVFYYTPSSLRTILEQEGFNVLTLGGVAPYLRNKNNLHEATRRIIHHGLRSTPFSLQLYALATVL